MLHISVFCEGSTFCSIVVNVKLPVTLFCVCMCILPGKAVTEMTYTVSGETLNPTHSLPCEVITALI